MGKHRSSLVRSLHTPLAILLLLSALPIRQAPVTRREPESILAALPPAPVPAVQPAGQSPLLGAFTRDEALADGRRMLTVSATPLHYQADNGSWLPIDPRFTPAENGFTNFTNPLRLAAGERVATLNLRDGETLVQWQPLELALAGGDGARSTLAKVLDPASAVPGMLADGGRTVRYPASWSLAGLVEEVIAAPGAVEQSLIFDQPPSPTGREAGGESKTLTLLATLRLPPSAALYANGHLQPGSFTTAGQVEIRNAAGNTALVLAPVIAYEQADPAAQTAGQYTFTPTDEGEWQVAVQTPWAWWADPARAYPVVLDPTMKMLGPITTAQLCAYYSSSPCPLTGSVDPNNGADILYIGRSYQYGITSALIRFDNLPTLPPGYVVEQADLLIAPKNYLVGSSVTKTIRAWQVTSAWDPATVYYLNNDPSIATPHLDQKYLLWGIKPAFPVSAEAFATRFHLDVSLWLAVGGDSQSRAAAR